VIRADQKKMNETIGELGLMSSFIFNENSKQLKHRSRMDIIANLLYCAIPDGGKGVRKTSLMYRSNLSYRVLHSYMDHLVKTNLLAEVEQQGDHGSGHLYLTTEKGRSFLRLYEALDTIVKSDGVEHDVGLLNKESSSVS
jgi:predicted transcriptional regulator